jgi:acetyltransferase-like isoleucine patch superfamily enzyme
MYLEGRAVVKLGRHIRIMHGSVIHVLNNGELTIGDRVNISHNVTIYCLGKIYIGDRTRIAHNVSLIDHDYVFLDAERVQKTAGVIKIGENCVIGTGVIILKNVTIGSNAVLAAGAMVTKDVPNSMLLISRRTSLIKSLAQ